MQSMGWHSAASSRSSPSGATPSKIVRPRRRPFLETLRKKGLEALYTVDPVDEHHVHQLREFDGMKLKSTTKEGSGLNDKDEMKRLVMKEVLSDKVDKVLVNSHMALTACPRMASLLRAPP